MKRLTTALSILLLMSVFIGSCDEEGTTFSQGGTGVITAKIDGADFSANVNFCTFLDSTLNVGGIGQDAAQLQLNKITATTGTYDLSNQNYRVNLTTSSGAILTPVSGTVTVTSFTNSRAAGTFQGTFTSLAGGTFNVTSGTFEANL